MKTIIYGLTPYGKEVLLEQCDVQEGMKLMKRMIKHQLDTGHSIYALRIGDGLEQKVKLHSYISLDPKIGCMEFNYKINYID